MIEVKISGVIQPAHTTDVLIDATARREDGTLFAIRAWFKPSEFDGLSPLRIAQLTAAKIQKSLIQLTEYQNCECKAGKPCDRHKDDHNPFGG